MSKARRYLNDNKASEQLLKDLEIIKQIAERDKDTRRVKEVIQKNFDERRGAKWSV